MNLPEGWATACEKAEDRLRDYTPIEPINAAFCLQTECPAARVLEAATMVGNVKFVYCQFSRCIRRYPTNKERKHFK